MNKNKVLLTAIAFMTYMIMSGLLTQIGVILNAFSKSIGYPTSQAVAVFSYLTGGALIGTFISLGLYSRFALGSVLKVSYGVFLCVMLALVFVSVPSLALVKASLLILGICCGCGLSGGAVIISKSYNAAKRASAFIATDCSFSAAGYIFPTIAIFMLAQNMAWTWSYAAVGIIALCLFLMLFLVRFPETEATQENSARVVEQLKHILTLRVILMGMGVCAYLIAQTTFLSWAPNYLELTFALASEKAASVVSNYWGLSIFGLLSSALLIHVIRPRWMLMGAVTFALIMSVFFSFTKSADYFLVLSFAFGFFTTCIYKIAMAVGSEQIANAPAMLVTFLLFSGGVGSASAPALSGVIVSQFGLAAAMYMTMISFAVVVVMFSLCLLLERYSPNIKTD
ncbi:MFS transporter TsgA [Glaciecola petra]|uniref:MFS transporter TsgA n=1 Tax=Glaciecola petra TaxID=3075602 RepID=A0ABU2ZU36_9ALTE|nr:MFS transporter TsgA [Aestuariibacter sp. P117]MDT0596159.1 MFS transporter TsgA [Aestuariibacter sp. P117]